MAASLQQVSDGSTPKPQAANAPFEKPDAGPARAEPPPLRPLVAPWHVRHARLLIGAAVGIALLALAYGGFQLWRMHTDPLDRVLTGRSVAPAPVREEAEPPPPPVVAPVAPKVRSGSINPGAARPRVTHTLTVPPAPPPVAEGPKPAAAAGPAQACAEPVAALGLCPAGPPASEKAQ
jgi:hypothetical protein